MENAVLDGDVLGAVHVDTTHNAVDFKAVYGNVIGEKLEAPEPLTRETLGSEVGGELNVAVSLVGDSGNPEEDAAALGGLVGTRLNENGVAGRQDTVVARVVEGLPSLGGGSTVVGVVAVSAVNVVNGISLPLGGEGDTQVLVGVGAVVVDINGESVAGAHGEGLNDRDLVVVADIIAIAVNVAGGHAREDEIVGACRLTFGPVNYGGGAGRVSLQTASEAFEIDGVVTVGGSGEGSVQILGNNGRGTQDDTAAFPIRGKGRIGTVVGGGGDVLQEVSVRVVVTVGVPSVKTEGGDFHVGVRRVGRSVEHTHRPYAFVVGIGEARSRVGFAQNVGERRTGQNSGKNHGKSQGFDELFHKSYPFMSFR